MRQEIHELGADTPGQSNALRVLRFEGRGDGPSIYLQAALHAGEMPGLVALHRLIPMLARAEAEGRLRAPVTVVPAANPIGLAQTVFGTPHGRFDFQSRTNFNRDFPRDPRDLPRLTVVETLKQTLLDLAAQADVILDLHCDDEGPVYLYAAEDMAAEATILARALGAGVILTFRPGEGASFDETSDRLRRARAAGAAGRGFSLTATVEFRGMLDVTNEYAEADARGLYAFLAAIGSIEDSLPELPALDPVIASEALAELIPTPASGAVLYRVEIGETVSLGQPVAEIVGAPGAEPHVVCAPFDGLVMTRRERRFVRRGEDVVKILRRAAPGA